MQLYKILEWRNLTTSFPKNSKNDLQTFQEVIKVKKKGVKITLSVRKITKDKNRPIIIKLNDVAS